MSPIKCKSSQSPTIYNFLYCLYFSAKNTSEIQVLIISAEASVHQQHLHFMGYDDTCSHIENLVCTKEGFLSDPNKELGTAQAQT